MDAWPANLVGFTLGPDRVANHRYHAGKAGSGLGSGLCLATDVILVGFCHRSAAIETKTRPKRKPIKKPNPVGRTRPGIDTFLVGLR